MSRYVFTQEGDIFGCKQDSLRFMYYHPILESRPIHSGQQYQTQALALPQDLMGTESDTKPVIPVIDHRSSQTCNTRIGSEKPRQGSGCFMLKSLLGSFFS